MWNEEERAQERGSLNPNFYSILIEQLAFCSHVVVSNGESDGEFSVITEKWSILKDHKCPIEQELLGEGVGRLQGHLV